MTVKRNDSAFNIVKLDVDFALFSYRIYSSYLNAAVIN